MIVEHYVLMNLNIRDSKLLLKVYNQINIEYGAGSIYMPLLNEI